MKNTIVTLMVTLVACSAQLTVPQLPRTTPTGSDMLPIWSGTNLYHIGATNITQKLWASSGVGTNLTIYGAIFTPTVFSGRLLATNPTAELHITNGAVGFFRSPSHPVDIISTVIRAGADDVSETNHTLTASVNKDFYFLSMDYSASDVGILRISCTSGNNTLRLGGAPGGIRGPTIMTFSTYTNLTSTTAAERMRITSAGRVGIGTTTPASLLDVAGTATASNFFATAGLMVWQTNAVAPEWITNGLFGIWNSNGTPFKVISAPGSAAQTISPL